MVRPLLLAGAATLTAAVLAAAAHAQPPAMPMAPLATLDFIRAASTTDTYEREAGQVAARRAMSAEVRQFGGMMSKNHAKTTAALKRAVAAAHLHEAPGPALSPDLDKLLGELRGAAPPAFDRQYIHDQIMVHEKALGTIKGYAMRGDNPVIREAAAKTVPIVEEHLRRAREIEDHLPRG
ncbi:MAG: hypothetical protein JWO72_2533 [Caulobacteraceae bacterium]|nr:hypothetical protein [Caulobacteraceae bacterium]